MIRVVVTEFPESAMCELKVERAILGPDVEIVQYCCDGVEENLVSASAQLTSTALKRLPTILSC
jgi:hypothetical protein